MPSGRGRHKEAEESDVPEIRQSLQTTTEHKTKQNSSSVKAKTVKQVVLN